MDDVYNNIDDYNPKMKGKILIVFDDMIADIMTNKKFEVAEILQKNLILFSLLMLHYLLRILRDLERIFQILLYKNDIN